MIRRLFIANRGEISLRVIRTARRLGIVSILGVSEADRDSLPARMADQTVVIGPAAASQSYLNVDAVLAAITSSGADAVHPGYGFLSENASFAKAVRDAGVIFVGPTLHSLEAMGDKLMARKVGMEAGLPVVPGGEAADKEAARQQAEAIGFPLLLKAVSGGGGKGMKRVDGHEALDGAIDLAMAEAQSAFGDPRIYVERFVARGRHVEVQILGDGHAAIHLGTRDCSIQRRFQKLVEEAPAPALPDNVRASIEEAAVRLANHLQYVGAGTVEFLVDATTFEFYFLEMNARIQVEHPVSEEISGIDLIEQQLLVGQGHRLAIVQDMIQLRGHAIEVRINAEDPDSDFRPSPGTVQRIAWPAGPHIRIDSHIVDGCEVPPYYDSLIGKLIVWGETRPAAIARLSAALDHLEVAGISSTAPLHRQIAKDARFAEGGVDTRFFEELRNG